MSSISRPDKIGAHRRAETIREGMRSFVAATEAIAKAYEARDWVALGYPSWDEYCQKEFAESQLRLNTSQREQAVLAFRGVGMSTRAIAKALGVGKSSVGRTLKPAVPNGTPAANPEGDSPVLGGRDGAATDLNEGGAHGRGLSDPEDSPAAELIEPSHAGVPAVGDQIEERTEAEHEQDSAWHGGPGECGVGCSCGASFDGFNSVDEATDELALHIANPEERDEEEAVEASADLPAAATTSLPDGDGDPVPEQSQQPGQDSPPVLGSEGFPGRAETDHHRAGVSGGGHAPRDSSLVELEEFEDDDDTAMPSSSSGDPRDEHTPTDLLLMTFDALINLIDHLDAEAVGPLLFPAELEQLHQHVDALSAFVARVSKARFEAMQRTP